MLEEPNELTKGTEHREMSMLIEEGWESVWSGPPSVKCFGRQSFGSMTRTPLGDLSRTPDNTAPSPEEYMEESWESLWGRSLKCFAMTPSGDSSEVPTNSSPLPEEEESKKMDVSLQVKGEGDDVPSQRTTAATEDLSTTEALNTNSNPTSPFAREEVVMEMIVNIEQTEEDISNSITGPSTLDSGEVGPQVTSIEKTERGELRDVIDVLQFSYTGSASVDGRERLEEQPGTSHLEIELKDEELEEKQYCISSPSGRRSELDVVWGANLNIFRADKVDLVRGDRLSLVREDQLFRGLSSQGKTKLKVMQGMRQMTEGFAEKVMGLKNRIPRSLKAKAQDNLVKATRQVLQEITSPKISSPTEKKLLKSSRKAFEEISNQSRETPVKTPREVFPEEISNEAEEAPVATSQEASQETSHQAEEILVKACREVSSQEISQEPDESLITEKQDVFEEIPTQSEETLVPASLGLVKNNSVPILQRKSHWRKKMWPSSWSAGDFSEKKIGENGDDIPTEDLKLLLLGEGELMKTDVNTKQEEGDSISLPVTPSEESGNMSNPRPTLLDEDTSTKISPRSEEEDTSSCILDASSPHSGETQRKHDDHSGTKTMWKSFWGSSHPLGKKTTKLIDISNTSKPTRPLPADILLLMDRILKEDFSCEEEKNPEGTSIPIPGTSKSDSGSTQAEKNNHSGVKILSIYMGGAHKSGKHGRLVHRPEAAHTSEDFSNTTNHVIPLLQEDKSKEMDVCNEEEIPDSISGPSPSGSGILHQDYHSGPSTSELGKTRQENHSGTKIRQEYHSGPSVSELDKIQQENHPGNKTHQENQSGPSTSESGKTQQDNHSGKQEHQENHSGPSTSDSGKTKQENHPGKKNGWKKRMAFPSFLRGGDHPTKNIGEHGTTTLPPGNLSDTSNSTFPLSRDDTLKRVHGNIKKEEEGDDVCSPQTVPTASSNPNPSSPLPIVHVMKKGNVRFEETVDSIPSPTSDEVQWEDGNQSGTKNGWNSMEEDSIMQLMGMPQRFSYEELSIATGGFSKDSKLGQGGFGNVYQGVLTRYNIPVAVKKIHSGSLQGEKEFMAEVSIISQLRHRNLIQILGWCKDVAKETFLLVYELMPNGSLDKALFGRAGKEAACLTWQQRYNILTGAAAALDYLHQGLKQQVIHRDIKSSNIMLDEDWNAKLGDFGLARLVGHQQAAAQTMVAGTPGYIAPEVFLFGRFTDKTDVFAFGVLILEVACGRQACSPLVPAHESILANWVWDCYAYGNGDDDLLSTVDKRLEDYDRQKMKVLLTVGLLCTRSDPEARPLMRHVVQMLAGDMPVPSLPASQPTSPVVLSVSESESMDDLGGPKTGSSSTSRSGLGELETVFAEMTGRLED